MLDVIIPIVLLYPVITLSIYCLMVVNIRIWFKEHEGRVVSINTDRVMVAALVLSTILFTLVSYTMIGSLDVRTDIFICGWVVMVVYTMLVMKYIKNRLVRTQ